MDIDISKIITNKLTSIEQLAIKELSEAKCVLDQFINNKDCIRKIAEAAVCIANSFKSKGKVISCGNGGSHCDAMHFAEELTGKFRESRRGYPAIAISDPSHISCVANDFGFDEVFSRFIESIGNPGDSLLAITTSGNSKNILKAIKMAREKQMKIILLSGNSGGNALEMSDIAILVPHQGYADRIQEIHIKIIHTLILAIENLME